MLTAFLASLVEFIEALTIVLAVGAVRGWRGALSGTGLALAVLLGLVLLFGPALAHLPKLAIQLGVGTLMLLFGMRWLRKAILREAGVIPLHDEADAYARELASLNGGATPMKAWDAVAVSAAFNITMLERCHAGCPYPQCRRYLKHSSGENMLIFSPMVFHKLSRVLGSALRSNAFSLANTCSIGLKS
jgi:uncharacterized membrane protein